MTAIFSKNLFDKGIVNVCDLLDDNLLFFFIMKLFVTNIPLDNDSDLLSEKCNCSWPNIQESQTIPGRPFVPQRLCLILKDKKGSCKIY